MTSHCLIHSIPACTAGSALCGKPTAMLDVTHLPDMGQAASAARDMVPCMVEGVRCQEGKGGKRRERR